MLDGSSRSGVVSVYECVVSVILGFICGVWFDVVCVYGVFGELEWLGIYFL